jgi:hypothetical protein
MPKLPVLRAFSVNIGFPEIIAFCLLSNFFVCKYKTISYFLNQSIKMSLYNEMTMVLLLLSQRVLLLEYDTITFLLETYTALSFLQSGPI